LTLNKQFGKHWNVGVDWHDMFDALCSDATVNRHAANLKVHHPLPESPLELISQTEGQHTAFAKAEFSKVFLKQ
jgi:hypothetical protein